MGPWPKNVSSSKWALWSPNKKGKEEYYYYYLFYLILLLFYLIDNITVKF